ncbi:LysE family translocator [Vibrio alginolyticus]|nr:LysE family translocator [Vibrio alginolyticus]
MSFEGAVTFFIAMFVFSITPGPGVFAILARAMVDGPRKCFMLAAGMAVSDLFYLVFACLGLATIAENWAVVFVVIRYVGAAYLIYLGYKMFVALPKISDELQSEDSNLTISPMASFIQGFLISASNPKVILFYISFLPTFIDLTALQGQDITLAAFLAFLALMLGLMLIAYGAGRLVKLLKTQKAHKRLNQSAGGIMVAAGAYLAVSK